ncbi:substrate-binding domain-containing protein [Arthrobacter sp. MI7-26]|uniref:sugar ABC transporter substrate-binding protein n=1 Tax=Arthrobacter sp. MI7-26 TaxID=2993653 RepID=UPI00224918DC|nr:substrate-binding domain-containing protein [Arthrobacter sp. MI7-26]MCX2749992.1 substrate-binding domain-containing protein [Arthrobacter sp. MI7-26]
MNKKSLVKGRGLGMSVWGLTLAAGLVALSACGNGTSVKAADSSLTSEQVAAVKTATDRVNEAKKPVTFVAPGPKFSTASAKGKKVFFVANFIGSPFTDALVAGLKEALEPRGVQVEVRDAGASPAKAATYFDQAISQKADAILNLAISTDAIKASVESAKAAGIPVVQMFNADPGAKDETSIGVAAQVSFGYGRGMALVGDYAIMASAANVNAAAWESTDVGTSGAAVNGLKSEFAQLCPKTCNVDTLYDAQAAVWAQRVPSQASAALKNSKINWLLPLYDSHLTWILPQIVASSRNDVRTASFNGNLAAMQAMQKDPNSTAALVHSPLAWAAWATADQTLRVLTGMAPLADTKIPLRLFDKSNIPDLNAPESTWEGADFKSGYSALWL